MKTRTFARVITTMLALTVSVESALAAKITIREQQMRAIELALKSSDMTKPIEILNGLLMKNLPRVEKDRVLLTLGRIYYQEKSFDKALEAYEGIKAPSEFWFEALEERAWTHMQKEEPGRALGLLNTVVSPMFKDRVVSEPYFLMALAQLRTCDYAAVFKTMKAFKDRFRDKVKGWESNPNDPLSVTRLKTVNDTVQKMNLVDSETIQRLVLDDNGKKGSGKIPSIRKKRGELSFPHVAGEEVWTDEVDGFRVSVRGCGKKGASL